MSVTAAAGSMYIYLISCVCTGALPYLNPMGPIHVMSYTCVFPAVKLVIVLTFKDPPKK